MRTVIVERIQADFQHHTNPQWSVALLKRSAEKQSCPSRECIDRKKACEWGRFNGRTYACMPDGLTLNPQYCRLQGSQLEGVVKDPLPVRADNTSLYGPKLWFDKRQLCVVKERQ